MSSSYPNNNSNNSERNTIITRPPPSKFQKFYDEPLVPIGAFITALILIGGVANFTAGKNPKRSQYFMRARVVAQGFTLAAIAYGSYTQIRPPKQIQRKYTPEPKIVESNHKQS
jgi:hypothetical protein